ncbi:MAG: sugar transferase [Rhodobacteraceae bacterium]|nr:sugar transferase [Paracoccaceae bacterium]
MAFDTSRTFEQSAGLGLVQTGLYVTYLKRGLDIVIVLLFALPVLLIVAFLALLVALDGGNPFYAQRRIGLQRRPFRMWKLRSMVADADQLLERHLATDPAMRREWDLTQKLKADPRITPIGRLIRKTSLDELPQLWNVLTGDMSLIGPRPMMPGQDEIYPGTAYYAMRPGLSGYWQTSVRNDSNFAERAYHDTQYFHDQSLLTDITVMMRTVRVVLQATGH